MRSLPWCKLLAASFALAAVALAGAAGPAAKPRARTFDFTYAATVTGLKPGQTARVWLPVPPANEDQDVAVVSKGLPAEGRVGRDPVYHNQILYVEAKANGEGKVPLEMVYRVTRREVKGPAKPAKEDAREIERLLQADKLVPLGGKPQELLEGKNVPDDPMQAARLFYDVVNGHMRYDKSGTGWGRGDAVWACDSKAGNCSDFHSLFISLARTHKLPAKFEIGFPLPPKPGAGEIPGYHCWAKFRVDKGWVPVDISEANKNPDLRDYYFGNSSPDRVAFSTGRDLELVPRQAGPPLNFFVYPYVEVDGKPYPDGKVERHFSYRDQK
jgi:transglutaminase-like putative cysteine protease